MLVSRGRNPSAGEIISQLIQAKALRKLRHPSRAKKLKDYLD